MVWVIVVILAVALAIAAALLWRERRSRQLREGFGPEYQRTVEERGSRREAESDLLERRERREQLEIRELEPEARERFLERWRATQRRFVDEPIAAVAEADELVKEVMRDRGYPVDEDFERRAADVSVDHPSLVDNYRAANEISVRTTQGDVGTEDLRQAMVHFRALFEDLLGADGEGRDEMHEDVKEMS
jgi:hypothetical protein